MNKDITNDPFPEYYKLGEPEKEYKAYAWSTAIGLQAVDGLMPSEYLFHIAKQNIEGEISFADAKEMIDSYYRENPEKDGKRYEEADKVSQRIARILSEKAFVFSPETYISIHKRLFEGIYPHAGKIRTYNITKSEWVLDGDNVMYGNALDLRANLEYDFQQEMNYSYTDISSDELIHHLALFVSHLWQNHIFSEGNTRTTAVFFIQYLMKKGYDVTNDTFAKHAWYFRNALVRANYNNVQKGIYETTEYLELFLRDYLFNETNELRNRYMHVSGKFQNPTIRSENPTIGANHGR